MFVKKDPTQRFSDKVDNYVKYRPSYPEELVDELIKQFHINAQSVIADVGAGTGIFTQLLINRGGLSFSCLNLLYFEV